MSERDRRVLAALKAAGERGVTLADFPPGLSVTQGVKNLRDRGHQIATLKEPNSSGRGQHGRYVLLEDVQ